MLWLLRRGDIAGRAALDGGVAVAAPVNTVAPVISGTPTVGSTLTTTTGTWTGTGIAYTYQWKRGGVNIGGATANSYVLVTADVGTIITATVIATNAGGSSSATSSGIAIAVSSRTISASRAGPGSVVVTNDNSGKVRVISNVGVVS
jgi:hypothetical protein